MSVWGCGDGGWGATVRGDEGVELWIGELWGGGIKRGGRSEFGALNSSFQ